MAPRWSCRRRAAGTTARDFGVGVTASLININTASATDLEALSGIGEVLAAAIVDYRTENGPSPASTISRT